jgi:hypothetical protein
MGQRSQTFLRVKNPLFPYLKEADNTKSAEIIKKWVKILGTGEYTILAYHHQWLYGMTFANIAHTVLDFYHGGKLGEHNHPLNNVEYFVREMFRFGDNNLIGRFIDLHTWLMSIHNLPWAGTRERGYEGFTFLNESDPWVSKYFDQGDNNDGVCVIDCITGKYAFLKMYGEIGEKILPNYTPLTAVQYVECYYPLDANNLNERCTPEEITEATVKDATKRINLVTRKFKKYELLTVEELSAMFPKCATKLRNAQKKAQKKS